MKKMAKPLALEYSGENKYYTYQMFESLQYGQSEREIHKKFDQNKEIQAEVTIQNSAEEEKGERIEESSSDDSISSSNSDEAESDSDFRHSNCESLRNEIKELRNEFKISMEKIAAPLNIIATYIMQNQMPKLEVPLIENIVPNPASNQDMPQSDVVIHTIEDYQAVRDLYPYEIFLINKLKKLDSWYKKEYSEALKLADNIEPLAYFLFKNPSFTLKTMKSFISTCKEYFYEYSDFDLEKLKSFYIEKDFKKSESIETLKKKWHQ